jgi:recombination protein RecT
MAVKDALAAKAHGAVSKDRTTPHSIKDWIKVMEPAIKKALPSVITPERFTRMVMTAVSSNPQLAECSPASFCGAMMQAAQLGLEPNTPLGQAYLIPYRNHGKLETQFQCGYKGMITLAYRSGQFKSIYAREVYEKDEFSYEYGLELKLHHVPSTEGNRGKVVFYYGVFTLTNGGCGFEVMSTEEVKQFAKTYSQSYKNGYSSPWKSNFDEMAKKTVLKRVLKYAPLSVEFAREVEADETIKTSLDADMVGMPDETDYTIIDDETGEVIETEVSEDTDQAEPQTAADGQTVIDPRLK